MSFRELGREQRVAAAVSPARRPRVAAGRRDRSASGASGGDRVSAPRDRDHEKLLIKQRVSLAELLREVVAEVHERGADDVWACCPFHDEDTPSFHVVPSKGFFKCFGCGEKGDVFTFVQKTRGVDFREALEVLAERAGVTLGSLGPDERRRLERARHQRHALEQALATFRRALASAQGRAAAAYLRERGFTPRTLEAFDVGYVPDGPGGARAATESAGFTRQFGGRIAFGIRDAHGALVGFGARRLSGDDGPKYVNTRETAGFSKGRLLYGFDKASRTVARTRRLVVMEGYTDVMMAHQRGLTEAVATMGTSLTAQHVALLRGRGVRNLILVFDGDEPGQAAAARAVDQLLAHGLEGRVLSLPDGADPCEWFSAHDAEAFDRLVAREAVDGLAFSCRRALAARDPGQPGVREDVAREVADKAAPLLADVVRREAVVTAIARETGLSPNALRALVAGRPSEPGRAAPRGAGRAASAEVRCQLIAVVGLVDDPARLAALDELAATGALENPTARALYEHARALLADGPLDPADWLARAGAHDPALEATLERLLMPPPSVHLESWDEAVAHLRARATARADRQAIRAATSRLDLDADPTVLSELQARLRSQHATGPRPSER